MTKFERIQLIRTYFKEVNRIDGTIPCILWKHLWEKDMYLYSREDDSALGNEVFIVKSPTGKVDRVLKYAVKHYFQTAEELEAILRTLSEKHMESTPKSPSPKVSSPKVSSPKASSPKASSPKASSPKASSPTESVVSENSTPTNMFTQSPGASRGVAPGYNPTSSGPAYSLGFSAQPKVKEGSSHRVLKIVAVLVLLLLLVAFYTNPSEETHRRAVTEKYFAQASSEGVYEASLTDDAYQTDTSLEQDPFEDELIPSLVHRKNYYLFSLTQLRFEDTSETLGFGLFGHVWLTDPEATTSPETTQSQGAPADNGEENDNIEANTDSEFVAQPVASDEKVDDRVDREALKAEMQRAIIVAVMEKVFDPISSKDQLTYKFVFHNRSNRNVKSFQGIVRFSDSSGKPITTLDLVYERPLGIGERATYHLTADYDPSDEVDLTMRRKTLDNLKVDWVPDEIIFNDGSKLSL